jgi:hypothetical protein
MTDDEWQKRIIIASKRSNEFTKKLPLEFYWEFDSDISPCGIVGRQTINIVTQGCYEQGYIQAIIDKEKGLI